MKNSMAQLFVDTWGWLTLRDKAERRHAVVVPVFESFQSPENRIFTTDFVLDETFTLLFRRLPFAVARDSMELLAASIEEGSLISIPITGARFKTEQALRIRYQDKPVISFTDLTSIAVMQEFKIQKILTEDSHFAQVGMEFELIC
jgi:predicted nucleic acid-binding protein